MTPQGEFRVADGCAFFRPTGQVTIQQVSDIIADAITRAAGCKCKKLLVDVTQLTGFKSPTTLERLEMVERWAGQTTGVRLAVVARLEWIDPERFGVTVALNRGLNGNIFTSEAEAKAWLLA